MIFIYLSPCNILGSTPGGENQEEGGEENAQNDENAEENGQQNNNGVTPSSTFGTTNQMNNADNDVAQERQRMNMEILKAQMEREQAFTKKARAEAEIAVLLYKRTRDENKRIPERHDINKRKLNAQADLAEHSATRQKYSARRTKNSG